MAATTRALEVPASLAPPIGPSQQQVTRLLIQLLVYQLRIGCDNQACMMPLCASRRRQSRKRPARELTIATARALAFTIATDSTDPESQLCQFVVQRFMPAEGSGHLIGIEAAIRAVALGLESDGKVPEVLDAKSTSQILFLSDRIGTFLSHGPTEPEASHLGFTILYAQFKFETGVVSHRFSWQTRAINLLSVFQMLTHWEAAFDPKSDWANLAAARQLAADVAQFMDSIQNSAMRGFAYARNFCTFFVEDKHRLERRHGSATMAQNFLHAWNGDSCIERNSKAGHALLGLTLPVLNWDMAGCNGVAGPSEVEVDITKAISDASIDPTRIVEAWHSFNNGEKLASDYFFLGHYPCLFPESVQIYTFRGICFHRMSEALNTATLYHNLIHKTLRSMHRLNLAAVEGLESNLLRDAINKVFLLQVERDNLMETAFNAMWRRQSRELFLPTRVKITGGHDQGQDLGGVSQEFFRLVMLDSLHPQLGIFRVQEDSRMAWFQPGSLEPTYKYEILGLLMALAIHNGFTLSINFPLAFYNKLCNNEVNQLADIEDGWPTIARGLRELRDYDEDDFETVFPGLAFEYMYDTVDQQRMTMVMTGDEDDPDADASKVSEAVTKDNRHVYIEKYISCLTHRTVDRQIEAFKLGFHRILPVNVLQTVTPGVLRKIVEGEAQDVDTELLQRITTYDGFHPDSSYIKSFWKVVHKFSSVQKRQLLEFVTASDRVPANGLQSVPFIIEPYMSTDLVNPENAQHLPSSSTCFGKLYLPVYRDEKVLKAKLEFAIENARGFGLA